MTNSAPVTKLDSSEAKYKAPKAISIGSAIRPCGDIFFMAAAISGVFNNSLVIGVNTPPGQMVLTRILSLASVTAKSLPNKHKPPLELEYAVPLPPTRPAIEAIFTMDPPPLFIKYGITVLQPKKGPVRLVAIT